MAVRLPDHLTPTVETLLPDQAATMPLTGLAINSDRVLYAANKTPVIPLPARDDIAHQLPPQLANRVIINRVPYIPPAHESHVTISEHLLVDISHCSDVLATMPTCPRSPDATYYTPIAGLITEIRPDSIEFYPDPEIVDLRYAAESLAQYVRWLRSPLSVASLPNNSYQPEIQKDQRPPHALTPLDLYTTLKRLRNRPEHH